MRYLDGITAGTTRQLTRVLLLGALVALAACRSREAKPGAASADTGQGASAPAVAVAPNVEEPTPADAADVIRRYYQAIDGRDFRAAYALWVSDGAASGQSFAQFAAGFDGTARVAATVGAPGRVEGAAGSRYVTVPVTVRAETSKGEQQRFTGTYTLRRSVVDGATASQRQWRIYSAAMSRTAP